MILRRYGNSYRSVVPEFNARALTEVGFRSTGTARIGAADFADGYERRTLHELAPSAEGDVQDEAEAELLELLLAELERITDGLGPDEVAVIENDRGRDHPKTRQRTTTVVVEGENRLKFEYTLAPSLQVGIYAENG